MLSFLCILFLLQVVWASPLSPLGRLGEDRAVKAQAKYAFQNETAGACVRVSIF